MRFRGLGPHSFRRSNVTWRQEVGGSSIGPSKIAGHSTVPMTEEYTRIQLTRQEELTRRIQERLISVGEKTAAEASNDRGLSAEPEVSTVTTCSPETILANAMAAAGI